MTKGTKDNILQLLQLIEDQKLEYIFAVWDKNEKNDIDEVDLYTSFENYEIKKLIEILKAKLKSDEHKNKV